MKRRSEGREDDQVREKGKGRDGRREEKKWEIENKEKGESQRER